jgi:hypothetical protein
MFEDFYLSKEKKFSKVNLLIDTVNQFYLPDIVVVQIFAPIKIDNIFVCQTNNLIDGYFFSTENLNNFNIGLVGWTNTNSFDMLIKNITVISQNQNKFEFIADEIIPWKHY